MQVTIAVVLTLFTAHDLVNICLLTLLSFGLVQAFNLPVRLTIAPNLVPPTDLTPAISLNSALFNMARFVGPMIAGVVIANFGVEVTLRTGVLGMLIFIISLNRIKPVHNEQSKVEKPNPLSKMFEGVRYVTGLSSIGPLLLLIMISAVFSRSFMDLFSSFVDQIFGQGPEGLGMLFPAVGGGSTFGALWIANYRKTAGLTKVLLGTLFMASFFFLIFSATSIFWLGWVTAAFAGASLTITANSSQILLQNKIKGSMRGRVMSMYGLTYQAGPAIGALLNRRSCHMDRPRSSRSCRRYNMFDFFYICSTSPQAFGVRNGGWNAFCR